MYTYTHTHIYQHTQDCILLCKCNDFSLPQNILAKGRNMTQTAQLYSEALALNYALTFMTLGIFYVSSG